MDFINTIRLLLLLSLTLLSLLLTMAHCSNDQSQSRGGIGRAGGHDPSTGSLLYYGWFFDAQIANSLKTIYSNYLSTTYTRVTAVETFLNTVSAANNVTDPLSYFTKPTDPATGGLDPYFHVTAMYCGDVDCNEYTARVAPQLGKTFEMQLIGAFFTERTFGVRILLTEEQQELMNEDTRNRGADTRQTSLSEREEYPGITFEDQEPNFKPSQSRAHITLGCAPGIPAHITGPDLLEIVAFEAQSPANYNEYELDGVGVLRHYNPDGSTGETAFALYPDQKAVTAAKFEAYYMPPTPTSTESTPDGADALTLCKKLSVTMLVLWILHSFLTS